MAPTIAHAAFSIDQAGNKVTVHGDATANVMHVYDGYTGGGSPYSVPTVVISSAGGALKSDQSPDCAGSFDAGSERLKIVCSANVSLNIDLGEGSDALYLGFDPETGEPVQEILGVEVSDGTGNDLVSTYMQLLRFGSGGVESDPSLFDARPLVIDSGLGKDTFELATYPDPQSPGQETHGSQRIDVSYANRVDLETPFLGPQLFAEVPGAPPGPDDPVETTQRSGTYKNFQTLENDVLSGVFSVTGSQGSDLMFSSGTYPSEMHGAGGHDEFLDFSGGFLRAFGDGGDDIYEAGYPIESMPAPWLAQDSFAGGSGVDTITYQFAGELGVRINPGTNDNGPDTENNFIGDDVENFYGTPQPDRIKGTDEPNEIQPFEGSDVIETLGGDDEIYAEDSRRYRDKVDCGEGDDYSEFDYRALSVTEKVPLDTLIDCETQVPAYDENEDGCSSLDEGVVYGADSSVLDSDEDGRTNCEEIDGIDGRPPTNPIVPDTDSDDVLDGPDNCPVHVNTDQVDSDGDGIGDVCDPTPRSDEPPVAVDDSPSLSEDAPATAIDVLANDNDIDGGAKEITSKTDASHGTVTLAASGLSLTYAPAADYCGPDSFEYELAPGGSKATVSVTVSCVDDPPVAVEDSVTVVEDSGPTAIDVLANDTDIDGGVEEIASKTDGHRGTVAIAAGGSGLTYQPDPDYCGTDSFIYTLNGGSTATVSVMVTCVDDPPGAADDMASVIEDAPATAIDVLANDNDIDGGAKEITSKTDASHGTVTLAASGLSLTYAPAADYCGPDSFEYELAPGGSKATVSVTVSCVASVQSVTPAPVINNVVIEPPPSGGLFQICALQQLKVRPLQHGGLQVKMRAKQARLVKIFVVKAHVRRSRWHRFRRRVEREKPTTRVVGAQGARALGLKPGGSYRLLVRVINEKPECQARYRRQFRLTVSVPRIVPPRP